jgi:hypothetical protein
MDDDRELRAVKERLAEAEVLLRRALVMLRKFLTASDLREGKAGDAQPTTGGEVPASPDRAVGTTAFANRYHQTLGAKWMCEAIEREMATRFAQNANAQEFARHVRQKWMDKAYWRPPERCTCGSTGGSASYEGHEESCPVREVAVNVETQRDEP